MSIKINSYITFCNLKKIRENFVKSETPSKDRDKFFFGDGYRLDLGHARIRSLFHYKKVFQRVAVYTIAEKPNFYRSTI